ncbi:MAG: NAD(P)/FAD-dependent oxidoreductase [Ilumatobacteraceae bacterium]|nr:NAD(P)/FAD-dependent oxidoreductase [Ilumatobacteraceae bacterium]
MIGHDPDRTYRAAVIGAGSGGLTVAIGLATMGHHVALIEGGQIGGDCTNVGCIPSKALLHAAARGDDNPLQWARSRRDHLAAEEDELIEQHPSIHLVRGWAQLTSRRDPRVVSVSTADGVKTVVRAAHVVIAGGSRPATIDVPGLDLSGVVTNEELFEQATPPASLAIIGGGAIGVEMATAFTAAGSKVDIIESQSNLLPDQDPLIAEIVERSLAARGVTLHLGVRVESADVATGALQLTDGSKIDAPERVMMATGRRPRVDGLDLDAAGVAYTARGIGADEWGRTSVDGVWAIGDVTGNTLTTHGAGATGRRTVRAIAFPHAPKIARKRAIPAAVYSTPEVASVGLSLDELADWDPAGRRRIVVDYADIDRGFIDDIADGRLVLDVQRFNGKVLRAAIVGPGASNMIGLFTMAIDHGLGLRTLFPMVHPYPSHAEVLREAADQFAATTLNNIPTELSAAVRSRLRRTLRRKR